MGKIEIATVKSTVQVIECLAAGDFLGYRSISEIASKANLTRDKAYRVLSTLVACNWAEKTDHGFRLSADGLIKHLVYMQSYLGRLVDNYGVKVKSEIRKPHKEITNSPSL